jgi:hypothetical protein
MEKKCCNKNLKIVDNCTNCGYQVCSGCWDTSNWYRESCGYCDHSECNRCSQTCLKCGHFHCFDCKNIEPFEECLSLQPIGWWWNGTRKLKLNEIKI